MRAMSEPSLPAVEAAPEVRTRLSPRWRVLVHNDDVTPMDFVVKILQDVFQLSAWRAFKVMWEAHRTGIAHVVTEPLERAEFHVEQARSLSRPRGWPLSFSLEPEA